MKMWNQVVFNEEGVLGQFVGDSICSGYYGTVAWPTGSNKASRWFFCGGLFEGAPATELQRDEYRKGTQKG